MPDSTTHDDEELPPVAAQLHYLFEESGWYKLNLNNLDCTPDEETREFAREESAKIEALIATGLNLKELHSALPYKVLRLFD